MVDHTDIYGNNALHIAAIRNKLQIAMALYSKYPSLNCINEVLVIQNNEYPKDLAKKFNSEDTLKFLNEILTDKEINEIHRQSSIILPSNSNSLTSNQ